jgi:hypothetical protein
VPHGLQLRRVRGASEARERHHYPIMEEQCDWLYRLYATTPPVVKMPPGGTFNPNKVPVPQPPVGQARHYETAYRRRDMTLEMRA